MASAIHAVAAGRRRVMMLSALDGERGGLYRLADPLGGMVTGGVCHSSYADEPKVFVQTFTFPIPVLRQEAAAKSDHTFLKKSSSGTGGCTKEAGIPALAEMLERHAACCVDEDRVFTASANELGRYALDLSMLPVCSAKEMENPRCYVVPVQKGKPMRWVEGVSLATGKACALPFTMVYLRAGVFPQERLQAPISTGLAAHRSLTQALVNGLLETIERDALSLMWLQMMPGRQIGACGASATSLLKGATGGRMKYYFFDISTDLKVPVVCCIRRSPENEQAHTLLSCAAGFHQSSLVVKTIRDIAAHSIGFRKHRSVPPDFEDFTAIHHGATYMAHKDRASAFSFLLAEEIGPSVAIDDAVRNAELSGQELPKQQLSWLLQRLDSCGFEAYAVDLTSVEAFSASMRVVRVIVPGFQPLPYRYATRYLGHPRLYDAPRRIGHRVLTESQINGWPLPFA